jgi:suppressor of tumorigenicity protein 13
MGGMGDMMGKAQEMMKNPKVMEIMMKAQKNPKIMAAMQDCMSNPAAFAKYRNDPEMSEMIRELEKYM